MRVVIALVGLVGIAVAISTPSASDDDASTSQQGTCWPCQGALAVTSNTATNDEDTCMEDQNDLYMEAPQCPTCEHPCAVTLESNAFALYVVAFLRAFIKAAIQAFLADISEMANDGLPALFSTLKEATASVVPVPDSVQTTGMFGQKTLLRCVMIFALLLIAVVESVLPALARRKYRNLHAEKSTAGKSCVRPTKMSVGGVRWRNLGVSLPQRRLIWRRLASRIRNATGTDSSCPDQNSDGRRYLLRPSSFFVENGHVCGILGPSGAGKSTLLAALSGTTLTSSGLELSGSCWAERNLMESKDDRPLPEKYYLRTSNGDVAFLHQQDSFFHMMTPEETLHLAAYLQLPCNATERNCIVNSTLDSLGLKGAAKSYIGDRRLTGGGLSGGERRRLSVALELITSPSAFFADEPTTGLDSSQAEKVMRLVSNLAKERKIPAVCSIHQPRASIWKLLDCFILLAPGGRICYMGKREDAVTYFKDLGYACPSEMNPAEFCIDLVSTDTEDLQQAQIDNARIERLCRAFETKNASLTADSTLIWTPPTNDNEHMDSPHTFTGSNRKGTKRNIFLRFAVLLQRAWRQNVRSVLLNAIRLLASVGMALMFSELFRSVRPGKSVSKSVADRVALLTFSIINMCMLSVMKTLGLFGHEKVVVTRERMRNQYSGIEYLLAKALAEIPIDALFGGAFAVVLKASTGLRTELSLLIWTFSIATVASASVGFAVASFTWDAESALALGCPLMVIFMAVGVINPSGVDVEDVPPLIIQWVKVLSPIKWSVDAAVVAEFKDMEFGATPIERVKAMRDLPRMGALALVQNGNQVLDALGLSEAKYEEIVECLVCLAVVCLLFSWVGLMFFGPSFVRANRESSHKSSGTETNVTSIKAAKNTSPEAETSNSRSRTKAQKKRKRRRPKKIGKETPTKQIRPRKPLGARDTNAVHSFR